MIDRNPIAQQRQRRKATERVAEIRRRLKLWRVRGDAARCYGAPRIPPARARTREAQAAWLIGYDRAGAALSPK